MRRAFGYTGFGFGARNDAATPAPPPPPPPPPELFPDPTLADTDTANWSFDGTGFNPAGSADIVVATSSAFGEFAQLNPAEAHGLAMVAALTNGNDYTVVLTVSGFSSSGTVTVSLGGAVGVSFPITGNGPVSDTVTAGDGSFGAFEISGNAPGLSCTLTDISVKAA
jgi:hypothetical protein